MKVHAVKMHAVKKLLAKKLLLSLPLALGAACLPPATTPDGGALEDITVADAGSRVLVPDFSLPDENPASTTHGTEVSPRDKLSKVSAWYFGHAT